MLDTGSDQAHSITGRNMYPFNFLLPPGGIPCSYAGAHGEIEYGIMATIRTPWYNFNKEVEARINVLVIVDLNLFPPRLVMPVERTASKHYCCLCCASGPVGLTVRLPKTGFAQGEVVPLIVDMFNDSGRPINGITVCITEVCTALFKPH